MDLNLIYNNFGEKDEHIVEKVKKAIELGYETIAINTIIDSTKLEEKNVNIPEPTEINVTGDMVSGTKRIKILNRLTAVIKDSTHGHHLLQNSNTKKYDILAVRPVGEKMLQHVCSNLDIDIISVDFTEKLPFSLKRTYIGQAREKSIVFEIEYAPCLRDQTARRWVICNVQILAEISKFRNIIVSSGALKILELRGVHDVINLCYIFGLKHNQARAAVVTAGQTVISHSNTRRKTGAGYVSIQEIFKLAHQDRWLVSACRVPRKDDSVSVTCDISIKEEQKDDDSPKHKKLKK